MSDTAATAPTDETGRIADQLRRVWEGDPWYGSNVVDVLRGITPQQAAHRPIPQAHTIWEIALHMTSWNREVLRRLKTGVARDPQDGDWPRQPDPTRENWRWATEMLEASLSALIAEVERFPAARLGEVVGEARDRPLGSGVSYYVLLHGIVQHNVAHTAQMSLLKKAVHG
ncbi:MAG TPA: DinB family protein [Longimicrobium sp.]|nr:DinB family protein [Longimicrobium sp.]